MAKEKITIEKLAGMMQRGLLDTEKRLRNEMQKGFAEIRQLIGAVLKVVETTDSRTADVRSIRRIDLP